MSNGVQLAYPVVEGAGGILECVHEGLTKRERFAMAAMQGILSNARVTEELLSGTASGSRNYIASEAVRSADALLAALEETA